jgi:hypothetical protein
VQLRAIAVVVTRHEPTVPACHHNGAVDALDITQNVLVRAQRRWYLVVEPGPGRLLTVVATWPEADPLTRDDLVRVAGLTTVDDHPDVAWVGRA